MADRFDSSQRRGRGSRGGNGSYSRGDSSRGPRRFDSSAATGATVFLGVIEKNVTIVVMVSVRIVVSIVTSVVISAEDVVLIVLIAISVLQSMVIVARAVSVLAA